MLAFIETSIFTQRIESILCEDDYYLLQAEIIRNPFAGQLIPGGAGLRKLRWSSRAQGKGKRGGMRLIYYYYMQGEIIYMIYAYKKTEKEDLTREQLKILAKHVKEGVL